jgi:hypothetical protein
VYLAHVALGMVVLFKGHLAIQTGKWTFASMRAEVNSQLRALGKAFAALVTVEVLETIGLGAPGFMRR